MELPFTHRPGRRERHLRRQHENPLFAWPLREVAPEALLAAQREDHEDLERFREYFRALVQRAVDLPGDADSDTVLALKQDLERQYEQTYGLPEDHAQERSALGKLIDLIGKAVRRAAGADPLARQELDEEDEARKIHFRLLEQPLVADLLHPQGPIASQELAPSVLSATVSEVSALLEIFDPEQLVDLTLQCTALVERLESEGVSMSGPRERLGILVARVGGVSTSRH